MCNDEELMKDEIRNCAHVSRVTGLGMYFAKDAGEADRERIQRGAVAIREAMMTLQGWNIMDGLHRQAGLEAD